MSADQQQQPPSPGPKPQVVEFSVSLEDLLRAPAYPEPTIKGTDLVAAALAAVTIFKEAYERAPRDLERMLLGAWREVSARAVGDCRRGWEIQTKILSEYFKHSGDWGAMRDCLIRHGERTQREPGEFHRQYEGHLARARAEFLAQFGRERP